MTEYTEYARKRRKQDRRRNVLTALFAVAAVVFLALTFWQQATGSIPKLTIPTPQMPWHNAHDSFVAASGAIVDSTKIGYAISSKHTGQGDDVAYTLADKRKLVAENAAPLKTLRGAFGYPYQAPPARSFYVLFPYYAKFRGMARLLQLDQQVKAARGDWNGAVNSGLDSMQLGAQMGRGAVLIGSLVGIACQAIGRRLTWDEVDHLNASQCRQAAQRMEAIISLQVPFADTLQEEEWMGQAGLTEMFRKKNGRQELANLIGGASEGDSSSSGPNMGQFMMGLRMKMIGPRGVILNYTRYMDALRKRAEARYGERKALPLIPDDPINQMLVPVFSNADFNVARNEVQNHLLLVTFALRAYRLEHGVYPQKLMELQQAGYLQRMPDDPFGPTGKLQYRPVGAKYVLYSVGPDGRDDGGQPITDPGRSGSGYTDYARHQVQEDSTGDIVAGVNQ
jgi:hypothetical protein